jgi:hypothetical protein
MQVDGSPTVILMMQSGRDMFVLEHHSQLKAVQAFGAAVSILESLRKREQEKDCVKRIAQ